MSQGSEKTFEYVSLKRPALSFARKKVLLPDIRSEIPVFSVL